jgi:predicted DNA-binding protein (MmcQ/YjbR family)
MTPEQISAVALALPEATEEQPFGPDVYVYKAVGKVFAILQPGGPAPHVTLKCEPGLALELRAQYPAVTAGYHMNKKHWNTVRLDGSVPADEVRELVEHAYEQVVATLPKRVRTRLAGPA